MDIFDRVLIQLIAEIWGISAIIGSLIYIGQWTIKMIIKKDKI